MTADPTPSILWGDFEFHKPSSGRFVVEPPGWSIGMDRLQVVTIEVFIEGSTPEQFNQRFQEVFDAVNQRDLRLLVKSDITKADYLWDIAPFDGKVTNTGAMMELNPNRQQSPTSKSFTVTFGSEIVSFVNSGGALTPYTQVAENFNYAIQKNAGRGETRSLLITFATKVTESAISLTVSSVSDVGGKARFTTSAPHGLTFTAGLRVFVVTTNYNGWHYVSAVGASTIDTTAAYVAADSGTITKKGVPSTGAEAWAANKANIFTDLMGTANDGGRDDTTGLAIVAENVVSSDENGNSYTVFIQSAWNPRKIAAIPAQRQMDLEAETWEPEEWSPELDAGPKPIYVGVRCEVAIDKDAKGDSNYLRLYATVKDATRQLAIDESGESDLKLLGYRYKVNFNRLTVTFDSTYQGRNTTVLRMRVKRSKKVDADYVKHLVTGGFMRIQRPDADPPTFVVVTANRRGVGKYKWDTARLEPKESGYQFLEAGRTEEEEQVMTDFASDLYDSVVSIAFERVKMETGDAVRIMPVFTQGGA